jgi:hypothetical protein
VFVATALDQLPDDVEALKTALIETRAKLSGAEVLIAHLQLVIAKMKREMFGPRSERSQRLLDQLELQLEELAAAAGEDEARAAATSIQVQGLRGASRRAGTSRNTCRADASFTPHRPRARAAAAPSSLRSGRMSPRRSTSSRGNGS